MRRGSRIGSASFFLVLVLSACGADPTTSDGGTDEVLTPPSTGESGPLLLPDRRLDPAPRERPPLELPAIEVEPAPDPAQEADRAEPSAPPAARPAEAVEVAIAVSSLGAVGDPRSRNVFGVANLPIGSILAYEVVPARYDWSSGLWQADRGSDQARQGLIQTRPRDSSLSTMWGLMTLDFDLDFDINGFPCAPPVANDILDLAACPIVVHLWFSTTLEGPWGQVQQPQSVRDVLGERGERMVAPPCVACSTLQSRDRARVEYTWPRVDSGTFSIASTRYLSQPLDPDRFRP
jgi:hypothetical protein